MSAAGSNARPEAGQSVVTVGTYDGVHLGHRALLDASIAAGAALGLPTVAVTFDRHPLSVLRPALAPHLLTDLGHKVELLEAAGVDRVVVLTFDEARAAESAPDFVLEVLVRALGARAVYVGANFHFGHGASGDVALLQGLGERLGFSAHGVDLLLDEVSGAAISSSRIRHLVAEGALGDAARLLGRPHEVRGPLRRDAGGAVLELDAVLALPPAGSYAAAVGPPGHPGVAVSAEVPPERPGDRRLVRLSALDEDERLREGAAALRFGTATAPGVSGQSVGASDEHGR